MSKQTTTFCAHTHIELFERVLSEIDENPSWYDDATAFHPENVLQHNPEDQREENFLQNISMFNQIDCGILREEYHLFASAFKEFVSEHPADNASAWHWLKQFFCARDNSKEHSIIRQIYQYYYTLPSSQVV